MPIPPLHLGGNATVSEVNPTDNPHVFTAKLHDNLGARTMRLISPCFELAESAIRAGGQLHIINDQHGQPVLYLGSKPGLHGGAPATGSASKEELIKTLKASKNENLLQLARAIEHQMKDGRIDVSKSTTDNTATFKLLLAALQSGHWPAGLQISLRNNNIGAAGAQALASALQSGHCPAGLVIDLKHNNTGAAGAQALASALQSGRCPAGLDIVLWNNNIGDAGAQSLASALQSGRCPAGLKIWLKYNYIGDAAQQALDAAWRVYHAKQAAPAPAPASAAPQNSAAKKPSLKPAPAGLPSSLAVVALQQAQQVTPALLAKVEKDIKTPQDLMAALQLVANGIGLGTITLNDATRDQVNKFVRAAIRRTEITDDTTLRTLYTLARHAQKAGGLSLEHFDQIDLPLRVNQRVQHLEDDVAQLKEVLDSRTDMMGNYMQLLSSNIKALGQSIKQQNKAITQLNTQQQGIASKMCQIGQCMRTHRQIGAITGTATGVLSTLPVVGTLFGHLFETGVNLSGLGKLRALMAGLEEIKTQITDGVLQDVKPLTVGMLIPELGQHAAFAELNKMPLTEIIETIGTNAQEKLQEKIENIALSAQLESVTFVDAPSVTASSSGKPTAKPSAGRPTQSSNASAHSGATPPPSRQDSGLLPGEGDLLTDTIKGNHQEMFEFALSSAIKDRTINAKVKRNVNTHISSTALDIAAHYGRLAMAKDVVKAAGKSLRHADPIQALHYADKNTGKYDKHGQLTKKPSKPFEL